MKDSSKKTTLKILASALIVSALSSASAEPQLSGYLENDLELKRLSLELKKAMLSSKSTSIDNGFDIQLSTGTAKFTFSEDESYVKFEPNAKVTVPQASNLTFSTSTKLTSSNKEEEGTTVGDTKFTLSADIISGSLLTRKIALKKAERQVLEATRKLQDYALTAENSYYKQLKELFQASSSIISAQKTMYDDTIDFEEIKAKGYSTASSKYRQSELKVLSDKHSVETKIHDLEHDCAVFASKCNTEYKTGSQPRNFLPKTIPVVEALDILSFDKEKYTKIENAKWNQEIATLTRKADKNFTLSASSGYTIKNSDTKSASEKSQTNDASDTVDVGVEASFSGLSLGAGASIPTDGTAPIYSVTASLKPNSFRKMSIKKKQNALNEEEENIAIQSAMNSYDDDVIDRQTELNDIRWSKKTNTETYDMYVKLEADMARYLKSGVITESEYLNAFANKELYRIKLLIDDINLLIYNNELKLLFCRDDAQTEIPEEAAVLENTKE